MLEMWQNWGENASVRIVATPRDEKDFTTRLEYQARVRHKVTENA
jgi:hypothetical protein